jgi:hypothetical protein
VKYRRAVYAAAVIIFIMILTPNMLKEAGIGDFKAVKNESAPAEVQSLA